MGIRLDCSGEAFPKTITRAGLKRSALFHFRPPLERCFASLPPAARILRRAGFKVSVLTLTGTDPKCWQGIIGPWCEKLIRFRAMVQTSHPSTEFSFLLSTPSRRVARNHGSRGAGPFVMAQAMSTLHQRDAATTSATWAVDQGD